MRTLMGDSAALKSIDPRAVRGREIRPATVLDIIAELEKPAATRAPASRPQPSPMA